MGLKVKRSPLNQPNTGSPNSPLLILTLTSTGFHPHLFLLPDSSSRTAAASPPLPPHPLPPPSSTSAAAHPCLLHLRGQTASGRARRGSGAELAGAWCQAAASACAGATTARRRPAGRRAAAAARRAPGGWRAQLQSAGRTAARRGMEKRRGRPGFFPAWTPRRRLENLSREY